MGQFQDTYFKEHPIVIRDVTASQFAAQAIGAPDNPGIRYRVSGGTEYQWDGSNWVAMVSSKRNPVTGRIEFSDDGRYGAIASVSPRKGKSFKGAYGRRLSLWSALQSSGGAAALVATSDLPVRPDGATKVLRLDQAAGQSYGQATVETSDYATTATKETVGVWVKNPTGVTLSCKLSIFNASGANTGWFNFAVDPCDWTFMTISPTSMNAGSFVWGTDAVHFVRLAQNDALGDVWPSGAYCLFGPTYIGSKGRPRFVICNDDMTSTVYHSGGATDGWPASGKTFREMVEYYGYKGTLYCVPSKIDQSGYMTRRELLEIQDAGWAIGSHSWTHPAYSNRGLMSLGPVGFADAADTYHAQATNNDSAIYADIIAGIEGCRALGVRNPEYLFALPQGAWDASVRSAVIRSGIKHVRAISGYNTMHTVGIGSPSGAGGSGTTLIPGGWIHQGDAVQTDGATTIANCEAYIDACIALGATGANYHHAMIQANALVLDGMLSYLKTKSDAGLIDVMTMHEAAFDDGYI